MPVSVHEAMLSDCYCGWAAVHEPITGLSGVKEIQCSVGRIVAHEGLTRCPHRLLAWFPEKGTVPDGLEGVG